MKPRDFLNFFKTNSGKLVAFGALFACGLIVFGELRKRHVTDENAVAVAPVATNVISDKPQVVQSVARPIQPFRPPPPPTNTPLPQNSPPPSPTVFTNAMPQPLPVAPPHRPDMFMPISLFADSAAGMARPKKLSAVYAPFGRLIPCETIITVDSSAMQTPVVGLITENIYYRGKLLIPAGTEAHGMAQTDRQRDRIATGTSWKLVWQDGEEMPIKAIALDREFDNHTNQSGWALTDGSAGLRGEIMKSDNLDEIKLFAATFLSGAANALTEKRETIFGPVATPSLNNAPFQGAQAVLETYSRQIYDSIQKNGFYVRVPSGKQFYLYVLQTIDRSDATFGGIGLIEETNVQSLINQR